MVITAIKKHIVYFLSDIYAHSKSCYHYPQSSELYFLSLPPTKWQAGELITRSEVRPLSIMSFPHYLQSSTTDVSHLY